MEFAVDQVWTRGQGAWLTGKRIIGIDDRLSVTFFRVESINGGSASWLSKDLLTAWIEESGASLST